MKPFRRKEYEFCFDGNRRTAESCRCYKAFYLNCGQINPKTCQIAPTVMDNVTWEDKVMQEEIFGPIMPILTYDSLEEVSTM